MVRMSDAVWTGTVIERVQFMDARPVDEQPMGTFMAQPRDCVYYFRTIPMCDVKRKTSS